MIDVAPSSLTYSSNPATYIKGSAITANNPTSSGGAVATYSVSPALPAGLSLSTSTGVISGTPTAITSAASYTVTATNTGGSTTVAVSITVTDAAPASLVYSANPVTYTNGYAITNNTASNSGGVITTYTVSPALPAGLSLSMIAGTISGTPTAVTSVATYVITGTNTGGSTTASVSITVANPTIAVSANNNQTAAARSTLPSAFTAVVKDANGVVMNSQLVDWAVASGGGSVSSASNSTNSSGLSSSTLTLGKTAGANTVTATIDGTSVSVTFTATATTSNFNYTWSFASGTNYTYDSTKVDFLNGYAELTPINQTDNSNTGSASFNTGTNNGTAWDTNGNTFLRLDQTGTATDIENDSSWTPAWTSLKGYWKLNETSGSSVFNSSGTTLTGTVHSGVTLGVPGKLNTALTFDGTAGLVDFVGTGSAFAFGNTTFSVSLWLKTTTASTGALVTQNGSSGGWSISVYSNGSIFAAQKTTGAQNQVYSSIAVNDGNWHHVVVVTTTDTVTATNNVTYVYVDGKYAGTSGAGVAPYLVATTPDLSFGARYVPTSPSVYYAGTLDDVAIWNTGLTAAAVETIYQHESAKHAGTFTSRVMDGLNSTSWTTLAAATTFPYGKELPDTTTTPSPTPNSETSSAYSSQSSGLMSGIVALWHLDEASWNGTSGEVKDRSGYGNNGTSVNSATTAAGLFGNSGVFTGTNQYITIPTSTSVNTIPTTNAFTFSAWMKSTTATNTNNYPNVISNSLFAFYATHGTNNNAELYLTTSSGNYPLTNSTSVTDGKWHFLLGRYTGGTGSFYVDGVLASSTPVPGTLVSPGAIRISNSATTNNFNGQIDEVAIWNRALTDGTSGSANEILELYRRGVNRLRYQIQTCATAAACASTPNWKGPDGTSQSYFTELNNNIVPKDGSDLTLTDFVQTIAPLFSFSDYSTLGLSVTNQEFFQYRAVMESDDASTACSYGSGATWCSPELKSVTAGPNHYDTSNPTIVNTAGVNFATLVSLVDTLGTGGCNNGSAADSTTLDSTRYQLSPDGTNWYWYNGSTWATASATIATATASSALTGAVLGTFPQAGTVYFKMFLQSSGTSACAINSLLTTGTQ